MNLNMSLSLSSPLSSKTGTFYSNQKTIYPCTTKLTHLSKKEKKPSTAVVLQAASSENITPSIQEIDGQCDHEAAQSRPLILASNVVRSFYDGINRHDLASVENLISESCVYEDLIFPQPFVGRKSIMEFFGKFIDSISMDLQFVIDAISEEDSSAIGVTWHLEWKGKAFPFSKGCSFYQLELVNGSPQIVYARDSVEPAIKPGETALLIAGCYRSCYVAASTVPKSCRQAIN